MFFVALSLLWNRRLRREVRLIRQSPLFDAAWYFSLYPSAGMWMGNLALHYLHCGARKGCNPHPLFDTRWYLEEYPDVGAAGQNPLVHYLKSGAVEGRNPNPIFHTRWYVLCNRDAAAARRNPLIHYLTAGAVEGCDPNPLFESLWYLSRNPDVAALGSNPLAHYLDKGWKEGRNPGPHFDGNHYLKHNPDVAAARINPLVHFVRYGWYEGRRVSHHRNFIWQLQDRENEKAPCINGMCESFLSQISADDTPRQGISTSREQGSRLPQGRNLTHRWNHTAKLPSGIRPTFSVVIVAHGNPFPLIQEAVQSVVPQTCPEWELFIVHDGNDKEAKKQCIEQRIDADPRIKWAARMQERSADGGKNEILALCSGEFVVLLDHGVSLTPDALASVATTLAEHPETDGIYSDHELRDEAGRCQRTCYKPAWSPIFFLGAMYVGRLLIIRRSICEMVGKWDWTHEAVRHYEFLLRVSEVTTRIRHIPAILCHQRITAEGVVASRDPEGEKIWLAAVAAHLKRRGSIAEPELNLRHPGRLLLEPVKAVPELLISIIVPSTLDSPLLSDCLRSIIERTTYSRYEILLLVEKVSLSNKVRSENISVAQQMPGVRVVEYDFPFNYSRVNNLAAGHTRGDVLVFLNDDTSILTPKWLEIMVTHLYLPGVGAVGPRLLFPDGSIQHAGLVLGLRDTFAHVLRGFPGDADGYFGSLSASREVSAVTGACLMTRAFTYNAVGGMRECFVSTHQDVDLCLRIRRLGLSIVYAANAELLHHESSTRGFACDPLDREIFADRWSEALAEDAYYNVNFSRSKGDYVPKGD